MSARYSIREACLPSCFQVGQHVQLGSAALPRSSIGHPIKLSPVDVVRVTLNLVSVTPIFSKFVLFFPSIMLLFLLLAVILHLFFLSPVTFTIAYLGFLLLPCTLAEISKKYSKPIYLYDSQNWSAQTKFSVAWSGDSIPMLWWSQSTY